PTRIASRLTTHRFLPGLIYSPTFSDGGGWESEYITPPGGPRARIRAFPAANRSQSIVPVHGRRRIGGRPIEEPEPWAEGFRRKTYYTRRRFASPWSSSPKSASSVEREKCGRQREFSGPSRRRQLVHG